jgi:hypothetical protein
MEIYISRQKVEDSIQWLRINNALLRGETYVQGPIVVELNKFSKDRFEANILKRKVSSPSNKDVEDVIRIGKDGVDVWRQFDSEFNSGIVFSDRLSKDQLVELVNRGKSYAMHDVHIAGENLRELLVLVENAAMAEVQRK